jgi:hypothetical protein
VSTIADLISVHPTDGPMILLGHLQVTGGRLPGGFTSEAKPGSWQVSRTFLQRMKVDHIALGDFHARQHLADAGG